MLFRDVAAYFGKLEDISSRLEMMQILTNLFASTPASDIKRVIYLLQGRIAPQFEGKEIGFGEKMIAEGIAKATGFTRKEVDTLFSKTGDLGTTAEKFLEKNQQRSLAVQKLTVEKVFTNFEKIAAKTGTGSQDMRLKLLAELLNAATPIEGRYIARVPLGNVRLGVGDPTIMDAFALTIAKESNKNWETLDEDAQRKARMELRATIEAAYNIHSDLGELGELLKKNGIKGLEEITITPGTPIRPTAAERLPSAQEIIEKLGKCAVEAKYDGFRIQLSKKGNDITIFSRQSEDITTMFPEIIAAARTQLPESCIVEGEALAVNEQTQEYYPFQVTIQRKRKYEVEKKAKEYPLKLFLFDVMFVNGENMMEKSFLERRKKLETMVKKGDIITLSELKFIETPAELETFFDDVISRGLEGIMAKDLSAPYIAGARKFAWIKLKRSYKGMLNDTLDLVIIGYYTGKGKRTEFGLGALLVAAYNDTADTFESVAKIGTGMSEEMLASLEEMLSKTIVKKRPARVDTALTPDFFVEPKYVIEVRADEITKSPLHACNKKEGKGLALRFPRMISIRTDKKPETATTTSEVQHMFDIQKRVALDESEYIKDKN